MLNYNFLDREYSEEELKSIVDTLLSENDLNVFYSFLDEQFENMSENDQLIWSRVMELVDKNFYSEDNE